MKKLINKLLPKSFSIFLRQQKHKKYFYKKHLENINEDRIVEISFKEFNRLTKFKGLLNKAFFGKIKIDNSKYYFYPIAIIEIPENIDIYLKNIGAKSRNMNKKAQKNNIYCKEFNWNNYLDDIYQINNSIEIRQGRKMDDSYKEFPKEIFYPKDNDFSIVSVGAFIENKLIGYIELYIYGNFAMTNRILGHKEFLSFGIMNLMVKFSVSYAIETKSFSYLNYLTMPKKEKNSLSAFKYRVGFREYSLKELN